MALLTITNLFVSLKNALLLYLDENFIDVEQFLENGKWTKDHLTEATTDAGIVVADCLCKDGVADKARLHNGQIYIGTGTDATADLGTVVLDEYYFVQATFTGYFNATSAGGAVVSKSAGTATIQWLNAPADLVSISSLYTAYTSGAAVKNPMVSGIFRVTAGGTLTIQALRTTYYGTITGTQTALTIMRLGTKA